MMVQVKAAKKKVVRGTAQKKAVSKKATTRRVVKKQAPAAAGKSLVQEIEAKFVQAKASLSNTHEKEVAATKKSIDKLQSQLTKLLARQKILQAKKAAAVQRVSDKATQAAKNSAERARMAWQEMGEKVKEMRNEIRNARLSHGAAKAAQKKHLAMEKAMDRFEKDWARSTAPKPKARRRPRKKAAAVDSSTQSPT